MDEIRGMRNDMINQTDWTQGSDQDEAFRSEWSTYRQTLRDLPSSITDALEFNSWPSPPGLGPNGENEVIDWGQVIERLQWSL